MIKLQVLRTFFVLISIVPLSAITTACDNLGAGSAYPSSDIYGIDPLFQDFYDRIGGANTLGQAISTTFTYGNSSYQYTASGLLAYDPSLQSSQQFYLAPIGNDLGLRQAAVAPPNDPDMLYVDGHIIPPAFASMYQFFGARIAGSPLTEARYNPEMQRFEQYFENLGFYRKENDPPQAVYLLAYGSWKCAENCSQPRNPNAEVRLPESVGAIFAKSVERLGAQFTGFAISTPYNTPDGYGEQVFENVVLMTDPNQNGRVILRPITASLGIQPEPLALPSNQAGMTFILVEGERGHNVPEAFLDYLAQHGGLDASGPPISELFQVSPTVYRLCFTNLCLDERREESGPLHILPAALGHEYRRLPIRPLEPIPAHNNPPVQTAPITSPQPHAASPAQAAAALPGKAIEAWVRHTVLAPNQRQEFSIQVRDQDGPIRDAEPYINLTFSDGSVRTYYPPPTGKDGLTGLILEPIDAPTGSAVFFEVCDYNAGEGESCFEGSFLVWQQP